MPQALSAVSSQPSANTFLNVILSERELIPLCGRDQRESKACPEPAEGDLVFPFRTQFINFAPANKRGSSRMEFPSQGESLFCGAGAPARERVAKVGTSRPTCTKFVFIGVHPWRRGSPWRIAATHSVRSA